METKYKTMLIELYSKSMQPILLCDDKLNITWANKNALAIFPETTNKNIKEILPATSAEYMDILMQLLENKSTHTASDPYTVNFIPLFYQGKLQMIVAEIQAKNNITKEDPGFSEKRISLVSSQYRTSLANIFNQIPILALALQENELYADVRRLNNITKNCYAILKSTINIAEYEKIKHHVASYNPSLIVFNDYISDLCKSVELMLRSTDFSFKYEICGEKIITNADINSLNLAILNIIANACKYNNIEKNIKLTTLKQNDSIVINITDKGIGIPSENLEKIFEPYYTTDTVHAISGGVGLGLTIAKENIEKHGGSIIVNSVYNYGTTISIRIPIDDSVPSTSVKSPKMATLTNKFSDFYIFLAEYANLTVL